LNLEFKNLNIEIKEIDEKGTFKGLASPYNNIDYGNDRVIPTAGKRNDSKKVPFLWQHDTHKPFGELILHDTKDGIMVDGTLFLDKDADGLYMIPKAAEAYTLIKKGILKLSIGYQTLDFEYVTEGKKTIRNLKDIDIMEVSAVTFPMNDKAKITSVKEKGGNELEEKAMGFADLLKVQQANDMRWKLQDALNSSFRALMDDDSLDINAKLAQLESNINDFATAYKENMTLLLQSSAKSKTAKKEVGDIIEKKEVELIETKAGKKISKMNKTKLQQCKDMLDDLLGSCCEDDEEKSGTKSIDDNSQKEDNGQKIELKADELELLNIINQNFKIEKGDEI